MEQMIFDRTIHRKIWTFLANPVLYTPHMIRTVLNEMGCKMPNFMSATLYKAYAVKVLSETDEDFRKKAEALKLNRHLYCVGCSMNVDNHTFFCNDSCQVRKACRSYSYYSGLTWQYYSKMRRDLQKIKFFFSPVVIRSIAMAAYNIAFCEMDHPEKGYIDEMTKGGKYDGKSGQ